MPTYTEWLEKRKEVIYECAEECGVDIDGARIPQGTEHFGPNAGAGWSKDGSGKEVVVYETFALEDDAIFKVIIFHELGHIYHDHDGNRSLETEHEADMFSVKYMGLVPVVEALQFTEDIVTTKFGVDRDSESVVELHDRIDLVHEAVFN